MSGDCVLKRPRTMVNIRKIVKITLLRVIPTLTHYPDIVSDISFGSICGIHILTFFLAFYLTYVLTYFLAEILILLLALYLEFYLACVRVQACPASEARDDKADIRL